MGAIWIRRNIEGLQDVSGGFVPVIQRGKTIPGNDNVVHVSFGARAEAVKLAA